MPGALSLLRLLVRALGGAPFRRYLRLEDLSLPSCDESGGGSVDELTWSSALSGASVARGRQEASEGLSWDETVIFVGMPLCTANGERIGRLSNAWISFATGRLRTLEIGEGMTADSVLGTRIMPAQLLLRFVPATDAAQPHVLLVADAARESVHTGGLATAAGVAAARAQSAATVAGKAVARGGSKVLQSTARKAASSTMVRASAQRAKGLWDAFTEGYQEGLQEEATERE
jgi:hypothetical protein